MIINLLEIAAKKNPNEILWNHFNLIIPIIAEIFILIIFGIIITKIIDNKTKSNQKKEKIIDRFIEQYESISIYVFEFKVEAIDTVDSLKDYDKIETIINDMLNKTLNLIHFTSLYKYILKVYVVNLTSIKDEIIDLLKYYENNKFKETDETIVKKELLAKHSKLTKELYKLQEKYFK